MTAFICNPVTLDRILQNGTCQYVPAHTGTTWYSRSVQEFHIVHGAAKTAPTLSGAVLRRNLLDHENPTKTIPQQLQRCVQRIVQNVRKQVTKKHVDGFDLKDSFCSLHALCETNLFSDFMRKHNDPAYHFRLFEFVVLGSQVSPERDIVRITFSSVWMILNAFRAIVAGWGFQLNGVAVREIHRFQGQVLTCVSTGGAGAPA
jgi:hypothetical protein